MEDGVVINRPRWSIAPYFIVDDVVTTANYYRDQLGFHYERFWGEPPSTTDGHSALNETRFLWAVARRIEDFSCRS